MKYRMQIMQQLSKYCLTTITGKLMEQQLHESHQIKQLQLLA